MDSRLLNDIVKPLRECLKLVFPPVMPLLIKEASKQKPDFTELARLISVDPGLTVTVLSLANSSYYSLSQKVTDIKRAIVVLGSSEILKLAISVTLKKSISQRMGKCKHVEFQNWSVMIWSALASEMMARKICPEHSNSIYLCALVKDMSLLLLCCSDDPRLKKYLPLCKTHGNGLLCLGDNQLENEKIAWGVDHSVLTMELLKYWGFPKNDCQMLFDHHDLDNISDHNPVRQVMILGAYWSEVEMGDKGISRLFQVRTIAKNIFGFDDKDFETIRKKVSQRFNAMCHSLGISPQKDDIVYHEFPVSRIQDLYFAALELQNVQGDLQDVVRTIVKHMNWLWGIKDYKICLLSPLTNVFNMFASSQEQGISSETILGNQAQINPGPGIIFYLGDRGYLAVSQGIHEDVVAELDLYTNFLSTSFDSYFSRTQNITSKAWIIDVIPQAVARVSSEGRIIQVNKKFSTLFNSQHDHTGEALWPVLSSLVQMDQDSSWEAFLNSGTNSYSKLFCPIETHMEKSGVPCWHISAHRIRLDGVMQILIMLEDITEISTLEKDIVRQGEYLRGIINSMQDIVFTVDSQGTILFVSPKVKKELLGKNFFQVAMPSSVLTSAWGPEILAKADMPVEAILNIANSSKSMELVFNRLGDPSSPQYLIVGRDLTTIRRMEEKIKKQATFDHLTKVFNRYQFSLFLERETQRALRSGTGLGLIFLDMDKFKEFNDKYGHQKGDQALKNFGRLLINNSRKGMDYPCRYGGDEFVLLVTGADKGKMESLVNRLVRSFVQEFGNNMNISIGMAIMAHGETTDNFLLRADRALFKAKTIQGNSFVWAENN